MTQNKFSLQGHIKAIGHFQFFSKTASFCNLDHYQLKDETGVLVLTGMLSKEKLHLSQHLTNTVTSNFSNKILSS